MNAYKNERDWRTIPDEIIIRDLRKHRRYLRYCERHKFGKRDLYIYDIGDNPVKENTNTIFYPENNHTIITADVCCN